MTNTKQILYKYTSMYLVYTFNGWQGMLLNDDNTEDSISYMTYPTDKEISSFSR